MQNDFIACFYCDKVFKNEDALLSHQLTKHFKCQKCKKTFKRPENLVYHFSKIHNEILSDIPESKESRSNPNWNIYGMNNIPEDMLFKWRLSIDPKFKEELGGAVISEDGSVIASQTHQFYKQQAIEATKSRIYDKVRQFEQSKVDTGPPVDKFITAYGSNVSADQLSKKDVSERTGDLFIVKRKYESMMRLSKQIIHDACLEIEKKKRMEAKKKREKEIMYFQPDEDGNTALELRANYYLNNMQK